MHRIRTLVERPAPGVLVLLLVVALVAAAPALWSDEPPARDRVTRVDVPRHPVVLRPAGKAPAMATGEVDDLGRPIVVACSTCHSLRAEEPPATGVEDLKSFHKDFRFDHGKRACLACHDPSDYDALRLADGTAVPFTRSMELCAQCHGTQARDYEHGAHGGMSGHWDLTQGPRTRNQCVHCHDPHVPAFPRMHPTFKPRDRFLDAEDSHGR